MKLRRISATALFVAIVASFGNLGLAQNLPYTIRGRVDRDYRGPLCIALGSINTRGEVVVEWGRYIGKKTITGDRGRSFHVVSLDAGGSNVENVTIYTNVPNAGLNQNSCDSDTSIQRSNVQVHFLNWCDRDRDSSCRV